MRCLLLLLCALLGGLPGAAPAQTTDAARWVAADLLEVICEGTGRFGPGGLIETDLTGDGQDDLLVYAGGIACADGRPACGAAYCRAYLFVRERGQLVEKLAVLTRCAEIVPGGVPPSIVFCDRDRGPYAMRWIGTEFAR